MYPIAKTYDSWITITQNLAQLLHHIRPSHNIRADLMKTMEGNNGLLPDCLGLMFQALRHLAVDGRSHISGNEIGDSNESSAYLQHMRRGQIALHLIDKHEAEFMVRTEAGRADEVARLLVNNARGCRQLYSLDVSKGAIMAEHFYVKQPHQKLLRLLLVGGEGILRARTARYVR